MREAPFRGDLGCGVVVGRFGFGVRNVWSGAWCRVVVQRMSCVEMVVGWSEVEGGELATREGTRSGVPPLKHMPRFLAPVSQRLPHHQHDHHSGQIHQKLSAKLNHNDNVSLASQPCRRHHRPTICDRNRLPSPTNTELPPFELADRMPPTKGAATTTTATAP